MKMKILLVLFALFAITFASAGTFVVTSPTEGAYLGATNTFKFQITGATFEVTIDVDVTGPGGNTHIQKKFTPDSDGKINDSIPLNFSPSSPEGAYTIHAVATEPGNSYPDATVHVTVDVTKPKIYSFNPIDHSFVKGPIVPIVVQVVESNFKEYRVQVNSQDIPNNTGNSLDSNGTFTVNWDVTGILQDGDQTLTIDVTDLADNKETKTLTVTKDTTPPVTSIAYPRADTHIRPHSTISVIVNISDQSGTSVDASGVDVIVRRMDDSYLFRVPRTSFQAVNDTTSRWSGRIRNNVDLPTQFKIVVTTVDKAGNVGATQTTIVTVG